MDYVPLSSDKSFALTRALAVILCIASTFSGYSSLSQQQSAITMTERRDGDGRTTRDVPSVPNDPSKSKLYPCSFPYPYPDPQQQQTAEFAIVTFPSPLTAHPSILHYRICRIQRPRTQPSNGDASKIPSRSGDSIALGNLTRRIIKKSNSR